MAKHLSIHGAVQGVGYRASFATLAQALGLSGWVRNRQDGTVEALVAGETAALDQLVVWARQGPPSARVDQVLVSDADDAQIAGAGFRMLPTV